MTETADTASPPSLATRLAAAVRRGDTGHDRRAGVAVAVLLALAPIAVWAGARWTEAGVRRDIAAIAATAGPRSATIAARGRARAELGPLLATPGVAATIDALARALPTDAALVTASRGAGRRLAVEVTTADPDRLRAALRHEPALADLRDTGQRRGDGAMSVTLEQRR